MLIMQANLKHMLALYLTILYILSLSHLPSPVILHFNSHTLTTDTVLFQSVFILRSLLHLFSFYCLFAFHLVLSETRLYAITIPYFAVSVCTRSPFPQTLILGASTPVLLLPVRKAIRSRLKIRLRLQMFWFWRSAPVPETIQITLGHCSVFFLYFHIYKMIFL